MKSPVKVRERVESAKAKLKEYEARVKALERSLAGLDRALKALEPRLKRGVEQTQVIARGVRAGVRAGTAHFRASRRA